MFKGRIRVGAHAEVDDAHENDVRYRMTSINHNITSIRIALQNLLCNAYQALWPPSILNSVPVIKLLASLIKNTAAPRYSAGVLNRPNIFCEGQLSLLSGYLINSSSVMAVTMYPGEMVFTRMPYSPHSLARLRANCITPALEAL